MCKSDCCRNFLCPCGIDLGLMGLGHPSITVLRYGKPLVTAFLCRTVARRPCSLARQANSPRIASVAFPPGMAGSVFRASMRAPRAHERVPASETWSVPRLYRALGAAKAGGKGRALRLIPIRAPPAGRLKAPGI